MKDKNTGFRSVMCLVIMTALVFSGLGISGGAIADDELEFDENFFEHADALGGPYNKRRWNTNLQRWSYFRD